MAIDNTDLIKRFNKLQNDRNIVQQMWDLIEEVVTPYRGKFFRDQRNEGSIEWNRRIAYDATAIMAHQNLSASLHGALTSPSIKWFDMRFRNEKLNKHKAAASWIADAGERVYYELQDSNFNLEVNESYQDLAGFGTAMLTLEEAPGSRDTWNGLNFSAVPLKEGYFEEDYLGRVQRFYRLLQWTPAEIISRFGEDAPQSIKDKEAAGSQERCDVLFIIYPDNNRIVPVGEKASPSKRPIGYRYILKDSAETMGKPGGYYEMPAFVARWRKTSQSIWGNSPAMYAMPDIMSLNEARRMQIIASEKRIDPPLLANERAIFGDLDLSASTLSVVRDIDGIRALETGSSIEVSDHMVSQLQEAVKAYFFTDQLTWPQVQAQPLTATEAQIRYELMQRLLGPTLGRLQSDLLDPIVSRTFRMLARDGQIESPPDIVLEENAEFDIEYLGSLSRAQRVDQAAGIERWVASAGNMAPVLPDMLDVVDSHSVMRWLGRSLNVPPQIMRDEAEVRDVKKARDAAMAQQQRAMQAEQEGNAAKALGEGEQAMQAAGSSEEAP